MQYLWSEDQENEEEQEEQQGLSEKFLHTRSILVSGEINRRLAEQVIRQLLLLEAEADDPVKVFIDSPGGDVDAGFAIFDMLRFITPKVYILGTGLVASAAALILLAAPKSRRFSLPNAHYLIHQPLSGWRGVASDIEIHYKEIEKTKQRINTIIAQETEHSIKKIEKDTDRDYWMLAQEAKEYGLVHKIILKRSEFVCE